MTAYDVNWNIEVEADSFEEAAKQARQCQMPGTEALYFSATRRSTKETQLIEVIESDSDEITLKALVDITYRFGETETETTVLLNSGTDDRMIFQDKLRKFVEEFQDSGGHWCKENPKYWWCCGEYVIYVSNVSMLTHDIYMGVKDHLASKHFVLD